MTSKLHVVVEDRGLPVRVVLTPGQASDKTTTPILLQGLHLTGDVVAESEKQAVKDAPHGCAPAGGPKPDVPTQPTPAPEPEKPTVVAKPSEAPHRDQPIGGEKPAEKPADSSGKNDTASTDQKPTDKPSV